MSAIIDNLLNGNLTDAKNGAKSRDWGYLYRKARDDYGFSEKKARAMADYLKGIGSFAAYAGST